MVKVNDIIICWRLEGNEHDFISIDKILDKEEHNQFITDYLYYDIYDQDDFKNLNLGWTKDFLPTDKEENISYCLINEKDKYPKGHDNIIEYLKKHFYKKYKVDLRKEKLKKIK
jgi:hypothetical protein